MICVFYCYKKKDWRKIAVGSLLGQAQIEYMTNEAASDSAARIACHKLGSIRLRVLRKGGPNSNPL